MLRSCWPLRCPRRSRKPTAASLLITLHDERGITDLESTSHNLNIKRIDPNHIEVRTKAPKGKPTELHLSWTIGQPALNLDTASTATWAKTATCTLDAAALIQFGDGLPAEATATKTLKGLEAAQLKRDSVLDRDLRASVAVEVPDCEAKRSDLREVELDDAFGAVVVSARQDDRDLFVVAKQEVILVGPARDRRATIGAAL